MLLSGFTAVALVVLGGADGPTTQPIELSYWCVEASIEGHPDKRYDPGLGEVHAQLEDLPYDTFRKVKSGSIVAAFGEMKRVQLTSAYYLRVQPRKRLEDGRVQVDICVELSGAKSRSGETVKALDTRMVIAPGKKVRMGGLEMEEGEMVLVLDAAR